MTSRGVPSERACLQCQRRKTRCIGGRGDHPCRYCIKSGKECVVSQRPQRTPLTRRNLDEVESRCRRLETLLENQRQGDASAGISERYDSPVLPADGQAGAVALKPLRPSQRRAWIYGDASETLQYGWNESMTAETNSDEVEAQRDGMASLGGRREDTGYLGNSSGFAILESLVSETSPEDSSTLQHVECPQLPLNEGIRMGIGAEMAAHGMSTAIMQDQLIATYFTTYNSCYPILHEATFRVQYANRRCLAHNNSWQIIYFMVLAIGEWAGRFSSDPISIYYDAARSRFQVDLLESGSIQTVQALLLMANYLQKKDRPNTGFNFLGIAQRMAVGLGLHHESRASADAFSSHRRRMLFWILFCFDSGFSITTGRPIFTSEPFIDVNLPQNVDESQCQDNSDVLTEAPFPTTCSALIAQARLARLANKICEKFMSISSCPNVDEQTSVMEHLLKNWHASLPDYFFSDDVPGWFILARRVVLWKKYNVHILLLLASQRQQNNMHDKLATGERYRAVAEEALLDVCHFCQLHRTLVHRGLSWYAVYFTLQSALALSVHEFAKSNARSPIGQQQNDTRQYDDLIKRATMCLGTFAAVDEMAAKALRALTSLHNGVRRSISETGNGPIGVASGTERDVHSVEILGDHASAEQASRQTGQIPQLQNSQEQAETEEFHASNANAFNQLTFDFLDPSFQALNDENCLADFFQNCYGPLGQY